ncbi:putative membrane protein [Nocardioides thalensis]|uniref:Putative membrane protein n=1 Tax=Nocardioides thalensis TaxID=1914755 RepID=A0A853BX84_9ACTN|nr:YibE/F family protein [Nocardioides thalensis]NYI99683.1 putative membrane protein [Nocardioides thalensis]
MRRIALAVIAPVAVLTLVAMIWMWPDDVAPPESGEAVEQVEGEVTAIAEEACPDPPEDAPQDAVDRAASARCGTATVRLTSGKDRGTEIETALPSGPGSSEVEEGDGVLLIESSTPEGEVYSIVDHQRSTELWLLAAAFALAVVAFGRLRGLSALAGLAVTFTVLIFFVVPAILHGEPPLLVAIVGSAAVMLTVLYLTHGFSLSTTVAVLGTLASLALTGGLAALTVGAMHLSGVADDLSTFLSSTQTLNMQGLLLAGIVIGSLGVLDDVTVTQSATVSELARADPSYGIRDLYRAGMRVGRSHIASVINTIVLAYAGSALPLLILIVANRDPIGEVVTDQVIAQELVRSAVATLGLIAAVPITTLLAAYAAREQRSAMP